MSRFIETIHLKNGEFLNLLYHQERIDRTFREFFPGSTPLQLHGILKDTCNPSAGRYKYTLRYSDSFEGMNIIKYEPRKISRLFLKYVSMLNYSYKNADREIFEILREGLKDDEEILIVKNGYITDSTYSNLIFFDGNRWITPSTPLLKGTKRSKLLREGIIFEDTIRPRDLKRYERCSLINAMLDPGETEVEIKNVFS